MGQAEFLGPHFRYTEEARVLSTLELEENIGHAGGTNEV